MPTPSHPSRGNTGHLRRQLRRLEAGAHPGRIHARLKELLLHTPPQELVRLQAELLRTSLPRWGLLLLGSLHLELLHDAWLND